MSLCNIAAVAHVFGAVGVTLPEPGPDPAPEEEEEEDDERDEADTTDVSS